MFWNTRQLLQLYYTPEKLEFLQGVHLVWIFTGWSIRSRTYFFSQSNTSLEFGETNSWVVIKTAFFALSFSFNLVLTKNRTKRNKIMIDLINSFRNHNNTQYDGPVLNNFIISIKMQISKEVQRSTVTIWNQEILKITMQDVP